MGLKLADLRAVGLPMPSARVWSLLLEEEFFLQVGRKLRHCFAW